MFCAFTRAFREIRWPLVPAATCFAEMNQYTILEFSSPLDVNVSTHLFQISECKKKKYAPKRGKNVTTGRDK